MEGTTIISVDAIRTILENYRIGKKPLAKLLGWGETTIIRYVDGDVPTSEYSDKLKLILECPRYYYEILLKNRENLTDVAFRKSKKAVLNKMMENKINVIAQLIINLFDGQVTAMDVQSLLYYSQGFYMGFYGEPLFEDDYIVQEERVPYPNIFKEMKGQVLYVLEIDEKSITEREKALVKAIVDGFSWYGTATYKLLFNRERVNYRIARDKLNQKVVTKDCIKTIFKDIMSQNNIRGLDDIILYPNNKIKNHMWG